MSSDKEMIGAATPDTVNGSRPTSRELKELRTGLMAPCPGDILAAQPDAPEVSVERATESAAQRREEKVAEVRLHVSVPGATHNLRKVARRFSSISHLLTA